MPAVFQLEAVRSERIGRDDMATRLQISRVNPGDRLRVGKIHQLRQRTRLQALLLQKRAHAAIEKEYLLS